jgi:hypothetical protein
VASARFVVAVLTSSWAEVTFSLAEFTADLALETERVPDWSPEPPLPVLPPAVPADAAAAVAVLSSLFASARLDFALPSAVSA